MDQSSRRVLHLDLDAFFAAVEQRDKPSLRGRPVVVGGIGERGVVATASYEARRYGIHSAMPMSQARRRCPSAAVLAPRFEVYRADSERVFGVLRQLSDRVEPLSLDEAFVELDPMNGSMPRSQQDDVDLAATLRTRVFQQTGLTASVGIAASKAVAKIASELCKPDGALVVPIGGDADVIATLPVERLWGVGAATAARLRRAGIRIVADLRALEESEAVALLGDAAGRSLHRLAWARDDRVVSTEREAKSISAEDTFPRDLTTAAAMRSVLERLAHRVCARAREAGHAGRTITVKARTPDFTTTSRSLTLPGPTDDPQLVARTATALLDQLQLTVGVRLLGVGLSGLTAWTQDQLGLDTPGLAAPNTLAGPREEREGASALPTELRWHPGADVRHDEHGDGWVWGSGLGRVTVRFETACTGPGPVRSFAADDPALRAVQPSAS